MDEDLQMLNGNYLPLFDFTEGVPQTDDVPLKLTIPVSHTIDFPLKGSMMSFFKRSSDIIISAILLITIFSWLAPVIALLIKLDSAGPVFFLQKRNKQNGKLFTCIKFRSMQLNSYSDTLSTVENDSRITRFGTFLRKYHLDELPQLLNVLNGDMSLIGPRPHMLAENKKYRELMDNYDLRHQVKPGITGLAQSLGYHGSSNDLYKLNKRLELDILYINEWSVSMDVKILIRTMRMLCNK